MRELGVNEGKGSHYSQRCAVRPSRRRCHVLTPDALSWQNMPSSWSARQLFPPDANLSTSTHHLHYYLFTPELARVHLPAERRAPLLIFLHGGTKPLGRENDTPALPAEAFHSAGAQLRHPCFVLRPITVRRARNPALSCTNPALSRALTLLSRRQGQRRNWVHGTASPTHVGKPYHVTRVPSKPMLLLMRLISQTLRTEPSIDPTRLVLVGASMRLGRKPSPVWPGCQRGRSGGLAEAGRSSRQPEA